MKVFFNKLFFGTTKTQRPISAIDVRLTNIKAIWNNEYDNDMGIEKLFRLFLATSAFVFPGLYIKQLFGKNGQAHQDFALDVFVLFKVLFPVFVLYFGWCRYELVFFVVIWLMVETLLYVPTLIFASDSLARPRSYRSSMLLLFLNYLEIIFDFGVLYASGEYLNKPLIEWFDPVYFSFITSASVGYGDFYPVTLTGKFLVSCQSVVFLIFVVVFLNFFSSKVQSLGYFDHTK